MPMAHDTHAHGSDKGAAFAGLIGGFLFIAAVVYALVVWTNNRFDAHEGAGGDHAVAPTSAQQVA